MRQAMIPETLTLETEKVLLRPMEKNDFEPYLSLSNGDNDMWQYFTLDLGDPAQLTQWMNTAFNEQKNKSRVPFTIIDKETNAIAGSMSLLNISYHDKRVEIGSSWLGKAFRGNGFNRHAKFAMIKYCFEEQQMERVEFKTDVENTRARRGLEKIGGIEEGILRSHMTMWNNRRRTSIFYSILKKEWEIIRKEIFKDIV